MKDPDFCKFKKYHKNEYNRIIHIISFLLGIIAIDEILSRQLNKKLKGKLVILYVSLIYCCFNDINLSLKISYVLFLINSSIDFSNINNLKLAIILSLTFLIPELSHIIFKEERFLYERISEEKSLIDQIKYLIVHVIQLVPFCFMIN